MIVCLVGLRRCLDLPLPITRALAKRGLLIIVGSQMRMLPVRARLLGVDTDIVSSL